MSENIVEQRYAEVTAAASQWQQGDCFLKPTEYYYCIAVGKSITVIDDEGSNIQAEKVDGLCVLSQTCDIVRECKGRPMVDVAVLIKAEESEYREIKRGQRPQYAHIPSLESHRVVVDLDRVQGVEKSVFLEWTRTPGCRNDAERRIFAQALARKKFRFAFPDDFNSLFKKFISKIKKQHGNDSPAGKALESLREIRIRATPSWSSAAVELMIYFIKENDDDRIDGKSYASFVEDWMNLIPESPKYRVEAIAVSLERLTALEYVESDQLDLDNLSRLD